MKLPVVGVPHPGASLTEVRCGVRTVAGVAVGRCVLREAGLAAARLTHRVADPGIIRARHTVLRTRYNNNSTYKQR